MRIPSLLVAMCASLAIAGPLAAQASSNFPTKPLKLPNTPEPTTCAVAASDGDAIDAASAFT